MYAMVKVNWAGAVTKNCPPEKSQPVMALIKTIGLYNTAHAVIMSDPPGSNILVESGDLVAAYIGRWLPGKKPSMNLWFQYFPYEDQQPAYMVTYHWRLRGKAIYPFETDYIKISPDLICKLLEIGDEGLGKIWKRMIENGTTKI